MRWLLCAALVALPLLAGATDVRGVRVLTTARSSRREAVLVDALRIYTRDLGRKVRLGGAAPAGLDPAALDRIAAAALADGDDVVVWFGARDGAPVLYALRAQRSELRETPVESQDPLQAARTLALKVRALLASRADDRDWTMLPDALPSLPPPADTPAPDAPETASSPPDAPAAPASASPEGASSGPPVAPPASPTQAPPSSSPPAPANPGAAAPSPSLSPSASPAPPLPPAASPSGVVRSTANAPRRTWLEATVAYTAVVPTQLDWVRHGLTVRLAVPMRPWLAPFADASFTTEPSVSVDGRRVAGRIWPVAVGVAFRLRHPRWQLALGPRASLQIVDADARTSDGRSGAARRYAAGLGLLGEADWLFSRYVGAVASVSAEALVPRLTFGAGGPGATDLGWVQAGFSLGLVVSIP